MPDALRTGTHKVVKLDCGHALVDTRDNFLRDGRGVDMIWVEAVAQPRDTSSDLVELNALLASICMQSVCFLSLLVVGRRRGHVPRLKTNMVGDSVLYLGNGQTVWQGQKILHSSSSHTTINPSS
jgi:hypothetical protein